MFFLQSQNQIATRNSKKKNFENTFSPNRATLPNTVSINTRGVEPPHQRRWSWSGSKAWNMRLVSFGAHPHVSKRTQSNALSNKVCDLGFVYVHLSPSWSIWARPLPGPTSQRADRAILTLVTSLALHLGFAPWNRQFLSVSLVRMHFLQQLHSSGAGLELYKWLF